MSPQTSLNPGVAELDLTAKPFQGSRAHGVELRDRLHDKCAVVGVALDPESGGLSASHMAYLALLDQQHRGEESAGVVTLNRDGLLHPHIALGRVQDVFPRRFDFPTILPGDVAAGHTRYSTSGSNILENAQPQIVGQIVVAHNGNLTNAPVLRARMAREGVRFNGTSDTELINHLIAAAPKELEPAQQIAFALDQVRGSYSLTLIHAGRLFAVRDPAGVRPLFLAKLSNGWAVASEDCAFSTLQPIEISEVDRGVILEFQEGTVIEHRPFSTITPWAQCLFEYVYFAFPTSHVFGNSVSNVRMAFGRALAQQVQSDLQADIVVPVPDSGTIAATGFALELQLPLLPALLRTHAVHRSFILPEQRERETAVGLKFKLISEFVRGRRVAVVDDSVVRGTTSKYIVAMLNAAGAARVEVCVPAPMVNGDCPYGIDISDPTTLLSYGRTLDQMRVVIGADSLHYLDLPTLFRKAGLDPGRFCTGCLTGKYPLGGMQYP